MALAHPWLAELHRKDDEPVAPAAFDFSFESASAGALDAKRLKALMVAEIAALKLARKVAKDAPQASGALAPAAAPRTTVIGVGASV